MLFPSKLYDLGFRGEKVVINDKYMNPVTKEEVNKQFFLKPISVIPRHLMDTTQYNVNLSEKVSVLFFFRLSELKELGLDKDVLKSIDALEYYGKLLGIVQVEYDGFYLGSFKHLMVGCKSSTDTVKSV